MNDLPVKGDKVFWEGAHIKKKYFGEVAEVLEDSYRIRTRPSRALITIKADRVQKVST